jgi:hypothetical protein
VDFALSPSCASAARNGRICPDAREAVLSIFDAYTERNVLKIGHPPQLTPQQFQESLVALGEDLKNVPVSTSHNVADARDVLEWNVLVKEVAHRVDKDLPRASPVQRLLELLGHDSQVEALLERVSRHAVAHRVSSTE